jgi:hypothetical protein
VLPLARREPAVYPRAWRASRRAHATSGWRCTTRILRHPGGARALVRGGPRLDVVARGAARRHQRRGLRRPRARAAVLAATQCQAVGAVLTG